MTKHAAREQARLLRSQGNSLNVIARTLVISKSSASLWTRDIKLTAQQQEGPRKAVLDNQRTFGSRSRFEPGTPLTDRPELTLSIDEVIVGMQARRVPDASIAALLKIPVLQVRREGSQQATPRESEEPLAWPRSRELAVERRAFWAAEARDQYSELSKHADFTFGLGLYAGEGSKTGTSASISNSDPILVTSGVRFFRRIGVPDDKVRFSVATFDDIDTEEAAKFWKKKTGLVPTMYGASRSRAGQGKRMPSHFGTARIRVSSVLYLTKILTWVEMATQ